MSAYRSTLGVVLVAFSLGAPRLATADPVVLYSTFGPAPGYISGDWTPPSTVPVYRQSDQASSFMGFELSAPAYLTSITAPVVFAGGFPDGIAFSILPSAGGGPDFSLGAGRDVLRADIPPGAAPFNASLVTAVPDSQLLLQANTLYFLSVTSGGGFDALGWAVNSGGAEGLVASLILGPPALVRTGPLAAFELRGEFAENAPVPEPATIWLLTAGSAMLVGRLRKRR